MNPGQPSQTFHTNLLNRNKYLRSEITATRPSRGYPGIGMQSMQLWPVCTPVSQDETRETRQNRTFCDISPETVAKTGGYGNGFVTQDCQNALSRHCRTPRNRGHRREQKKCRNKANLSFSYNVGGQEQTQFKPNQTQLFPAKPPSRRDTESGAESTREKRRGTDFSGPPKETLLSEDCCRRLQS